MTDKAREKGLRQIASLRRLIANPGTEGERAAAQHQLEKLCAKWDQPVKPRTTQYATPDPAKYGQYKEWMAEQQRIKDQQDAARRKREAEQRKRDAEQAAKRAKAQEAWKAKNADRDAMGRRKLTNEEIAEARRDPLAWALKQDERTSEQKNRDMQNRHLNNR